MGVFILILFILFICILIATIVLNALTTKKKKENVQEFLSQCDEKQLAFINKYDACYKVGIADLWKKKKNNKK